MVDRTVYDADKTPDLPLHQVFGRQRVNQDLCKLAADSGLLTVETFVMLGDDIASVKATLKNLVPDHARFGTDAPAQDSHLTGCGVEDLQHHAGSLCFSPGEDGGRSIEGPRDTW